MFAASNDAPNLHLRISGAPLQDRRIYNKPSVAEIALFIPDLEPDIAATPRDIVVRVRGEHGGLKIISEYNAAFDPLHFVLLFPRGELGWTPGIISERVSRTPKGVPPMLEVSLTSVARPCGGTVTLREFLAYYLMERLGEDNPLHRFGALFQEWMVIQWAKVEQQRLLWMRLNQDKLRIAQYDEVRAVQEMSQATGEPINTQAVGRRVILASTFAGGPRCNKQLYSDGMAVVRKLGKADLFITFTANTSWKEVKDALRLSGGGSQASERYTKR